MKRKALISQLSAQGCRLAREGASHSIWFQPRDLLSESLPGDIVTVSFLLEATRTCNPPRIIV